MDAHDQASLEIEVTNFGPIADAKIALRPLTVFVGPSNTGKSYLAILIYALQRCIVGDRSELLGVDSQAALLGPAPKKLPSGVRHDLAEWWIQNFLAKDSRYEKFSAPLPESVACVVRSMLSSSKKTGNYISDEVSRCFGVGEAGELIRRGQTGNSSIMLRVMPNGYSAKDLRDKNRFEYNIVIGRSRTTARTEIPENSIVRIMPSLDSFLFDAMREVFGQLHEVLGQPGNEFSWERKYEQEALERMLVRRLGNIAEMALPYVFGPLHYPAHYLPADRAGIMHTLPVIVRSLVRGSAKRRWLSAPESQTMSGVLADFLNSLLKMDEKPRRRTARDRTDLGRLIERHILAGNIHVDSTEMGRPTFFYQPFEWQRGREKEDLPLINSSSMVSELAPVVFYLREIVRPGDVFIIEEPESHLHPAMQAALAKVLAQVVKQGIRVVITTHSDWFLEQIGNLVRLSELPEEHRTTITDGIALDPSEVGAWLFESKGSSLGSTVTEVKLDPDTGLYPVDYGDVRDSLYNESAKIFNKVQEVNGQ